MKKHFSSEFKGMFDDDKNDINVNLWDFEGSSFFLDRNINYNDNLGSTGTFINTEYNVNNDYNNSNLVNVISSKNKKKENIKFPVQKEFKNKSKFVNTNTRKGIDTPNTYDKKNLMKNKILKNNKIKKNKFKNNSFCHNENNNYNFNDSLSKNFGKKRQKNAKAFINKKNYNSKAKQRLNHSVGKQRISNSVRKQRLNNSMGYHSKKDDLNPSIILGYNNLKKNYNKNKNLNMSLPIDDLDNYFEDCENYSNIEDNIILNLRCNKYMSNNTKKIKKSNSLDNNIYNNRKITSNNNNIKYPEKLISNNSQRKKEPKINMENNIKESKNRSVASKKNIEDAEKYTHYLAKRKIFTHDYELQDKLRRQREELETQKEMSQCTFKPQLINNKYNTRIQSQKDKEKNKKSMYEKQSKWLKQLQTKNKNERDKKIKKEIQGCTFIPQLSSLPKYTNKNRITFREKIGEENYYNQMKKARQNVQERNKPDNLIERYDERRKREGMTPRPMLTFGEFDQEIDNINLPEEYNFMNINMGLYPNSLNNMIIDDYKDKINLNDYINNKNKINEDIINVNIKNNINDNIINDINFKSNINNNYVFNSNINSNYIELNNNNDIYKNNLNIIYDNNSNNLVNNNIKNQKNNQINSNINYLKNINNSINKASNTQKINNRNVGICNYNYNNNIALNSAGFVNNLNLNKNKNTNKNNSYNKYVNQRNKSNFNNFDLDKNFTEEIFMNNIQLNAINNYRNIFPKNEEQDKEIVNISTETGTKNNSILSLHKKSTYSLQDKTNKNENIYVNNISHFKIAQNQEFNQNNDNNNNDDEYNKQKQLLMNELHNWKNFDEDSNEDD